MGTYISNVKTTRVTASGAIFAGPCRILGIWYVSDGAAGSITIKDGGASGTLISNQIAYHMKTTLDWSFASAMGLMLLTGVLVVYWIYNKLVGIDNIKLG